MATIDLRNLSREERYEVFKEQARRFEIIEEIWERTKDTKKALIILDLWEKTRNLDEAFALYDQIEKDSSEKTDVNANKS